VTALIFWAGRPKVESILGSRLAQLYPTNHPHPLHPGSGLRPARRSLQRVLGLPRGLLPVGHARRRPNQMPEPPRLTPFDSELRTQSLRLSLRNIPITNDAMALLMPRPLLSTSTCLMDHGGLDRGP